jgi:hypothetical protein
MGLPSSPEGNALYLVPVGDDYVDAYITNRGGDKVRRVFNPSLVSETAGSASTDKTYEAGGSIGGNRAVLLDETGRLAHASADDITHANKIVGVTTQSGVEGGSITVRPAGVIEDSGWSFAPGSTIYLGLDGVLTTSPPPSGAFTQRIGYVSSPTKVVINIADAIVTS